jgi:hypothetical protein
VRPGGRRSERVTQMSPLGQNWKTFIKAGDAVFTIQNESTGNRLTFRVQKHQEKDLWFVKVLCGPDNESDYVYIGCIFGHDFRRTAASRVGEDAQSYQVFRWLSAYLESEYELPECVHVYHEGRCGRYGRRLTVPGSIEQGFGPECIHYVETAA